MEKLEKFSDVIRKYQVPMYAAYGIYLGWTGDVGISIETLDGWLKAFDGFIVRGTVYPTILSFSVCLGVYWLVLWLREMIESRRSAD